MMFTVQMSTMSKLVICVMVACKLWLPDADQYKGPPLQDQEIQDIEIFFGSIPHTTLKSKLELEQNF